ncbi:hypothetical protein [Roseomonas sp. TAS13]|uniref:hypothetical protein n=1 Tax=Roseomonas sp. TAS13 TaxID=1926319 RepID=UPI0011153739|nr:hypothetical protein [Roseomonas sp. TAS13]
MMEDRQFLKDGAVGLLTAIAEEHPLGHQPSKAARFVLTSRHGVKVEIMFEKNMTSPPNLWCLEKAASPALIARLKPKRSSASKLRTSRGPDGKVQYGRHSSLERMGQLGEADLVCFAPDSFAEIGEIIDRLRSVTASDLS